MKKRRSRFYKLEGQEEVEIGNERTDMDREIGKGQREIEEKYGDERVKEEESGNVCGKEVDIRKGRKK